MPPPAPIKPQIKPMSIPHRIDWMTLVFRSLSAWFSLVVITGFTRNLIPRSRVIMTEKLPMERLGTLDAMKLPTRVKTSTDISMMIPFLISRFLCFP